MLHMLINSIYIYIHLYMRIYNGYEGIRCMYAGRKYTYLWDMRQVYPNIERVYVRMQACKQLGMYVLESKRD